MNKIINLFFSMLCRIALIGCVTHSHDHGHDHADHLKFGAPTEGMSKAEYQSLVFLDPQNTIRADYHAVKGMDGHFLIDNQGEPTVSVVDYKKGETIKKIQMNDCLLYTSDAADE